MSIIKQVRCLKLNGGFPKSFWVGIIDMSCYLINRSPWASLGGKVVEDVWIRNPISFDHLRIFGKF